MKCTQTNSLLLRKIHADVRDVIERNKFNAVIDDKVFHQVTNNLSLNILITMKIELDIAEEFYTMLCL